MKWMITLLLIVVAGAPTGCKDPTIWSAQRQSPDGRWLAMAYTVQHSGPGTNGIETVVELKQTRVFGTKVMVLGFADGGADMDLQMVWQTPTDLRVTYRDAPQILYFQVVKTSGIDIEARSLEAGQPATPVS